MWYNLGQILYQNISIMYEKDFDCYNPISILFLFAQ